MRAETLPPSRLNRIERPPCLEIPRPQGGIFTHGKRRLSILDCTNTRIRIEGSSATGFDPSWLRNAVYEPLDEADIERTAGE
ncbi:MAG: hypothetical protein ACUVWX_15225 [Kiritimatiellia bacterium]